MATTTLPAAKQEVGELRFLIHGIDWEGYETLLKLLPRTRMTYDRGSVEFMSPLYRHENYAARLGRMLETLTEELDLPLRSSRSTTFRLKAKDRGLEPDQSYYLANAHRLKGLKTIDLQVEPPPDLSVEVDITSSSLDRMGIYASLRVPEVWRFDGEDLTIHLLRDDGTYEHAQTSAAFPFLPIGELPAFLLDDQYDDETPWVKAFRAWVRDVVEPRFREYPH
jgi:Uma2 family endonuclease